MPTLSGSRRTCTALSPVLTLQGAIAHCDMPVESGPTMYLPYSQQYAPGYLAWRRPEFKEYFARHHVQLPLAKGDAVFFNPALFHAAGTNRTTDVKRMANLLQVSSPFGRAIECVDRQAMANAVFPTLLARQASGASPGGIFAQRRDGLRRRVPLPHQPRSRPTRRRPRPRVADPALVAGRGGALAPRSPPRRPRRLRRPPRHHGLSA